MTHYENPNTYRTKSETEDDLLLLFDQIDALILDTLPDSLLLPPIDLIQEIYCQKHGILLTKQEIINAYIRYTEGGNNDD